MVSYHGYGLMAKTNPHTLVRWPHQNSRSDGQVPGEEEHGLHFRSGGCFLEGRLQYGASVCPSE